MAGAVLSAGFALGVGGATVVDLTGGLLLLSLGTAIRMQSSGVSVLLDWLAITLAFGAVALRWGSPDLAAIQGAQGVLGLGAGPVSVAVGTSLAGLACYLGLVDLLSPMPSDLEDRIVSLLGALAGGLSLAAVFLGRAGEELLTTGSGLLLGLSAAGLALFSPKFPRGAVRAVPPAALFLAVAGVILVGVAL